LRGKLGLGGSCCMGFGLRLPRHTDSKIARNPARNACAPPSPPARNACAPPSPALPALEPGGTRRPRRAGSVRPPLEAAAAATLHARPARRHATPRDEIRHDVSRRVPPRRRGLSSPPPAATRRYTRNAPARPRPFSRAQGTKRVTPQRRSSSLRLHADRLLTLPLPPSRFPAFPRLCHPIITRPPHPRPPPCRCCLLARLLMQAFPFEAHDEVRVKRGIEARGVHPVSEDNSMHVPEFSQRLPPVRPASASSCANISQRFRV